MTDLRQFLTEHVAVVHVSDNPDPQHMTRNELQAYLEGRGFAVYEHESTESLREAAIQDMECDRVSLQDIITEYQAGLEEEQA